MIQSNTNTLLRLPEVRRKTGLSRSTIYLYMSENRFPHSIKISEKCVAWVESDINAWINALISKSQKP